MTYESCQDQHKFDGFYAMMAASMQDNYPGITAKEMGQLMDKGLSPRRFLEYDLARMMEEWAASDPYPGYMTGPELCEQSGLTLDDFEQLGEAKLLLPDRPSGRYRPKLASWGQKLAYLLRESWTIAEIKRWSKGRWKSGDPRQWPPVREMWTVPDVDRDGV